MSGDAARQSDGAARPVVLVTSEVPPDRVASFRALHERMPLLVVRFGGERRHATRGVEDPGVPVVDVAEREVARLAREARVVVAGTVGRVALPAAYLGARRAGVPFVLWTALWAHPRTPAHVLSRPLLRHLYRHADAVVTYGPHVSAYVRARGAENVHVAPQAVDPAFWIPGEGAEGAVGPLAGVGEAPAAPADRSGVGKAPDAPADRSGVGDASAAASASAAQPPDPAPRPFRALFVGRVVPEKGIDVLLDAWRRAGVDGELVVVGPGAPRPAAPGVAFAGALAPAEVRNFMARASVLVMPSIATRAFREPWGLVANEAMHMNVPVIATDAVGAAAGGLVRHERNGLVVPAGDAGALASAIRRLAADDTLRQALGRNAGRDAAAFTPEAWAAGMAGAIESAELRRNR